MTLFALLTVSMLISVPLPALLPVVVITFSGLYERANNSRQSSTKKYSSVQKGTIRYLWFGDACGVWLVGEVSEEDEGDEGE